MCYRYTNIRFVFLGFKIRIMIKVVIGTLAVIWLWIVYEMHIAPEVDEKGNIIPKKKKKKK